MKNWKTTDQINVAPRNFTFKRFFDILLSGGILVVFSPVLLFLTFAVKATSPGPVFFTGERIGRGGKPFRIIKFRTMVGDAENLGSTITAEGDPRVTPIGRVLRRTKLDELPSLINALRGEMSIVGPRPETAPWIPTYTPGERGVLLVQPGITSLATIQYRHEEKLLAGKKIEQAYPPIMRDKLRIELEYLRNRSFLSDLKVIALTILAVFQKHSRESTPHVSASASSISERISPHKSPRMRRNEE